MFKVTKYPHGTFSWADCNSTDQNKAKHFYAEVMGWSILDLPIGEGAVYTMFQVDGHNVAGMGQIDPATQAMGVPSHWANYVNVNDIEAITAKAQALGATVTMPPMDVFDNGRMAILQDPTGAQICLWEAKSHIGADLVNTPGAMTWNELNTRDIAKAQAFYGPLFGWSFGKDEHMDYNYIFNDNHNKRFNGGMMPMDEKWGDAPANWMVYFSVADIDKAVEKVKALGGTLVTDIMHGENVGRFAVIADPAGAHFTIIEATSPQSWED